MKIPLVDLARQYQSLQPAIDRAVKDTLSKGDFILGENVRQFEQDFAKFCQVKYCVGVASGTDALLLSLRALGVGAGDEVIAPAFTFIATVLPIVYLGARPVLVDINLDTYQMDVNKLESVITKKTRVFIPVHLYGFPAPIQEIQKIAKKHKVYVLEDACQAHGSAINGRKCGSFGDLAAFSFYPSKNLGAAGDGGAVVTNSKKFTEVIQALRHVGQFQRYKHDLVGYNSRLDNLHAGILAIKLRQLEKWNGRRRQLAQIYDKLLAGLPIVLPPAPNPEILPNYHVYAIRTKKREKMLEFLNKNNISCVIHYPIPVHLQKSLRNLGYRKGDFPQAERAAQEVLSLPMFPELKETEVKYVCAKIRQFFTQKL